MKCNDFKLNPIGEREGDNPSIHESNKIKSLGMMSKLILLLLTTNYKSNKDKNKY